LHIFAEKIRKKNPWKAHDSNISTASIPYTVRFIKMSAEGEGAYRGAGAARRFVLFIVLFIVFTYRIPFLRSCIRYKRLLVNLERNLFRSTQFLTALAEALFLLDIFLSFCL
jgi:hypothetical protein